MGHVTSPHYLVCPVVTQGFVAEFFWAPGMKGATSRPKRDLINATVRGYPQFVPPGLRYYIILAGATLHLTDEKHVAKRSRLARARVCLPVPSGICFEKESNSTKKSLRPRGTGRVTRARETRAEPLRTKKKGSETEPNSSAAALDTFDFIHPLFAQPDQHFFFALQ